MRAKNQLIAFPITGEFAHFRNPFVTSYLSTYPFPPKPTVLGLIGAIMGYSPEKVVNLQTKVKIAIKLNNSPKKALDYITLWKFTDDKKILSSPVKMEILVKPDYTIFVQSDDVKFIGELHRRLRTRDFVYPVYLGKNEFIAFIKDFFLFPPDEIKPITTTKIDTILPVKLPNQELIVPDVETSNWATVGFIPVELELLPETGVRRIKNTGTFAYSLDGKSIQTKNSIQALRVRAWNIILF